jgi:DNA polymerase-3 subunit epsilon
MNSIWDSTFIVTDVETTGSDPIKNRITEIGCVAVNGGEIIDEFSSLINPHQYIPSFIVNMTGITNEMAARAPESYKVVPEAAKIFNFPNPIFVAHNVKFDFSFVQQTFIRENYRFDLPQLCTLKLARKMLPQDMKKNVGSLAKYFGIPILNRHRAFGDAEATAYILIELLEKASNEYNINEIDQLLKFQSKTSNIYRPLPEAVKRLEPLIHKIPNSPGVYYFKDEKGNVLFIGKAKSLYDKIKSYLNSYEMNSKKISDMIKNIHIIEWKETESELIATIEEAKDIKKFQPQFNPYEYKFRSFPYIKITNEIFPRIEKCYNIISDGAEYFGPFSNRFFADEIIDIILKRFKIRLFSEAVSNEFENKVKIENTKGKPVNSLAESQYQRDYILEIEKVRDFLRRFDDGILEHLKKEMLKHTIAQDFEKAAKTRDQINELKTLLEKKEVDGKNISDNNLILITPVSKRERLLDVLLIKSGILKHSKTVGRRAALENFHHLIDEIYFTPEIIPANVDEEIDQLRIINSWLYKHKNIGKFIYINGKSLDSVFLEFSETVREFEFLIDDEN